MPSEAPAGARDPVELPGGVAGNVGRGEGVRRGVGFAVGYKNHAYSGGFDDSSEARVTLSAGPEGPVAEVHCAAAEVGQGVHTILAQIARTVLGIERVILQHLGHAGRVGGVDVGLAADRGLGRGGQGGVRGRARGPVRTRPARREAGRPRELGVEDGFVTADGERVAPVEELLATPIECTRVWRHAPTHPLDERGQGDVHVGFLFGAQRAVVDVDEELGLVRVVQLATAQDVGFAINPQSVIGQIEGGSAQGLGLALMEEIQLRDGRIANASFTDYLLPTTLDMPRVEVELVEEPEPGTPFGAKGVGEPSNVVAPAAIASALSERARARPPTHPGPTRRPRRPDPAGGVAGAAPFSGGAGPEARAGVRRARRRPTGDPRARREGMRGTRPPT